jgi:hypothetical protein
VVPRKNTTHGFHCALFSATYFAARVVVMAIVIVTVVIVTSVVKVIPVVIVGDMETGDTSDGIMVVRLAVTAFSIRKLPDNLTRIYVTSLCEENPSSVSAEFKGMFESIHLFLYISPAQTCQAQ